VVRFRVDGMMYDVLSPPKRFQPAITSRVKVMAGLNIAEKRLPQDGRIRLRIAGRDIDLRVSSIPTAFGERIVLRLLDRAQAVDVINLDHLGFSGDNLQRVDRLIRQSHGIILATGPTGSGKSTTLYACLTRINSPEKNIITIEDPIEYQLRGVGQMQVNPKIELTFASGLRSILRQDPDVIMVGEIRDSETAEIAIQAALTGHLVFSTLHTNDSFGAVTRLVDMGIEPFLVANAVRVFIAQRLVRVLCSNCKRSVEHDETYLRHIGFPLEHASKTKASVGCEHCRHTGYEGRAAIFEFCLVSQRLQDLITQGRPASAMRAAAVEEGMIPLRLYGWTKVIGGFTTVEEVVRVTASDLEMSDE
jgi:general secretion pathway protein E